MKIWGISFGFNRRSGGTESPLALPAPEQPSDIMPAFQRAVYGVTCRTLSYPAVVAEDAVHYRALATTMTLDQWCIQKITERAAQLETDKCPVSTPNRKIDVVKEGLCFFDALTYLARVEQAAQTDPVGPTRKDLGTDHYEAFGLLHDIIPDVHGMPQPTIGGHPMVAGVYADTATAALHDARGQLELKSMLAPKAQMEARGNVLNLGEKLHNFMVQSRKEDDLKRAAQIMTLWVDLCAEIWNRADMCISDERYPYYNSEPYNGLAQSSLNDRYGVDIQCYRFDSTYDYRASGVFSRCEKVLSEIKTFSAEESATVHSYLREAAYIAMVQDAAYVLREAKNTSDESAKASKTISSIQDSAARLQSEANGKSYYKDAVADEYKRRFIADVESWTMLKAMPDHIVSAARAMQRMAGEAAQMRHQVLVEAKAAQSKNRLG
ncbi:hypothetical protein [Micavibrio aeruginosavorus]|uniref:hypothetical protein n=1 Tax=Micavibrio aeruginosavorus TaxID=349221 RepID=UPI000346FC51|nr:hypothetical protein [Micavibrio aeruginosavorus]